MQSFPAHFGTNFVEIGWKLKWCRHFHCFSLIENRDTYGLDHNTILSVLKIPSNVCVHCHAVICGQYTEHTEFSVYCIIPYLFFISLQKMIYFVYRYMTPLKMCLDFAKRNWQQQKIHLILVFEKLCKIDRSVLKG